MMNSLQQMYYGIRNRDASQGQNYSQAMLPPQAVRDSSTGVPSGVRPLQQTYSRYIDQQENYNHINSQGIVKNRVRFE